MTCIPSITHNRRQECTDCPQHSPSRTLRRGRNAAVFSEAARSRLLRRPYHATPRPFTVRADRASCSNGHHQQEALMPRIATVTTVLTMLVAPTAFGANGGGHAQHSQPTRSYVG